MAVSYTHLKGTNRNLHRSVHEGIAHHEKRQELRQDKARVSPHDHRVSGTNPIDLRHSELSLIGASPSKYDVTSAETELRADHIAALAPTPDMQAAWIEVIQTHVDFVGGVGWLDALVNAVGESSKLQALPLSSVEPSWHGFGNCE